MTDHNQPTNDTTTTRRAFLTQTAAATALATIAPATYAAESNTLKVGLIGCGGRGGGAAVNALRADPNTKLVAMADAFKDRLDVSHQALKKNGQIGNRVDVPDDHKFHGFDAYRKVIELSDVVLLATPPGFRPLHIEAAVEAGKHVFAEKPVAVDVPGIHRILKAAKVARQKNLSIVSGLCYRYDKPKVECIKQIHDGAIGDITALQTTYNTGSLWHRGNKEEWSPMEYQMRNWYYFTWLSGDFICEQHVHSLDKVLWAMGDKPPKVIDASGGRIQRTGPEYGNIYDHFNSVFEWDSGVKAFSSCRQWRGCQGDVSDYAFGTKGTAAIQRARITGDNPWRFQGNAVNMYDAEHIALFKAIRANEPIDNTRYMCDASLMGIGARMAAYTGKRITWQQLLDSKLDLSPESYTWGDTITRPVPIPGQTRFV